MIFVNKMSSVVWRVGESVEDMTWYDMVWHMEQISGDSTMPISGPPPTQAFHFPASLVCDLCQCLLSIDCEHLMLACCPSKYLLSQPIISVGSIMQSAAQDGATRQHGNIFRQQNIFNNLHLGHISHQLPCSALYLKWRIWWGCEDMKCFIVVWRSQYKMLNNISQLNFLRVKIAEQPEVDCWHVTRDHELATRVLWWQYRC